MDTHIIMAEVVKYSGLTAAEFATKIGAKTKQAIYDVLNGKTKNISASMKGKILSCHPEINESWLLTGEGTMLKSSSSESSPRAEKQDAEEPSDLSGHVIPLLPLAAQGGKLNDFVVSVRTDECERVISPIKGADFAMPVSGDSMAPEYPNGSQVHIKKIYERSFIEWGRDYVLDTCNGTVIKRIVPSEREDSVRCLSLNPDPIYAPFDVSFEDIYGMYRVLICVSMK